MGNEDGVVEIDCLQRGLLSESADTSSADDANDDGAVLYTASFQETEENYVKYQTVRWIACSLLLILAWGVGLIMLLYLPVRRYIVRKEFQSRTLYLTPNAIVYKFRRPFMLPCFGVLKKEKHILLPSVSDILIEQGYLQSYFGVYSIRIENAGVRRPASDDVQIQGIAQPRAFKKAVLAHASRLRFDREGQPPNAGWTSQPVSWEHPNIETNVTSQMVPSPQFLRHDSFHSSEVLLQKLEEVGSSVKHVERLIKEWHGQTLTPLV